MKGSIFRGRILPFIAIKGYTIIKIYQVNFECAER